MQAICIMPSHVNNAQVINNFNKVSWAHDYQTTKIFW